ncbi:FtsH extracellular protease family isoform 1 [Hibiscus syriacus]|uniref:FtsH extracellular protease family isoform 1 n=1 Tax=Hibiscus syriacus TaxID=106335 RepID=A0A6A2X8P7_HIBSY|nr:FtsH extracellular protease family isoform 1 [Hibiscus syriacus]
MDMDFIASGISDEDDIPFIDQNNDLSNFEGGRCGICMDIIIDRGVLDCCQHWFCFACIDNWATITNLCPLCQSEFQLITCVPVYDTIGSNKVEGDSFSRDDDWSIEGKSNTLSFPSYYIDENSVICLDGDGCKVRSLSTTIEGDPDLDTSIACDSCDIWYHAFCVGFDTEGTSEDTWLCPRCALNQASQNSVLIPEKASTQHDPDITNGEYVMDTTFSGKLSVSVADTGDTAVVVSMVEGNQWIEEPSENLLSSVEVGNHQKIELSSSGGNCCDMEKASVQPILEGQELELSLSRNSLSTSLSKSSVLGEFKTSKASDTIKEASRLDGVGNTSGKSLNKSYMRNQLSETKSSVGLNLGLSIVDDDAKSSGSKDQVNLELGHQSHVEELLPIVDANIKSSGSKDQVNLEFEHQSHMEELLPIDEKTELVDKENAGTVTGLKRKNPYFRSDIISSDGEETKCKNESDTLEKKIRVEKLVHMAPESKVDTSVSDDTPKCPTLKAVSRECKIKNHPEKKDSIPDVMSIVQGTSRRTTKGLGRLNSTDKSLKGEHLAGLRVKKIMRASDDKEASAVVKKLRKEIREAVHNKSTKEIGENLFDPQLLAAFRAAIAVPKTETVKKLSPSAIKMKKSLLQKGKVRENLTKKIYADSNGRRKRAWDRDCEVEFWKYRCMGASKPEKIETLKSVLDLLKKNKEGSESWPTSEGQASNSILSRLYLADTSVFPRKDDIRPLSALKATGSSEQSREQGVEGKPHIPSLDHTVKSTEANKVSSKVGVLSTDLKRAKTGVSNSKGTAATSKVDSSNGSEGSSTRNSKVELHKEVSAKSDDVKVDKRKLALAVLARKKAAESKSGTQEGQEDNAALKGNYPLLVQLPADMRPSPAPSRHNKIPISVRQAQLYRLTEHFLKKANLPIIRRTAETELAVADAINIEREVADRSNRKVVYLNLCSQEILHRSDYNRSVRAKESNTSSPSEIRQDQGSDACLTDPVVVEALRNAGLLSDSPPTSPLPKTEVPKEIDDPSAKTLEEEPDNIFEMDSHLEEDIYGDFEYDLEDEDYIGVTAEKALKVQSEEGASKMKVVFSTLSNERSKTNNLEDAEDHEKLGNIVVPDDSTCLPKNNNDDGTDKPSTVLESLPDEAGEELSIAECEELYGPDKEMLVNKFPEATQRIRGLVDAELPAETTANKDNGKHGLQHIVDASEPGDESKEEDKVINPRGRGSSGRESSAEQIQTGDDVKKNDKKSNMEMDKQSECASSVSKKVEAYIKEHIRPLCKSGVITAEQYRWAVAKTTDKVMKYHLNAKNANFLVKEGDKVKKLAEQYVEAAQIKEKTDPS